MDKLIELSNEQGILYDIAYLLLKKRKFLSVSALDNIKKIVLSGQFRNMIMFKEFKRVIKELKKHNIIPLIFKGFVFQDKYPDSNMRQFGDFDFQLKTDNIPKAYEILLKLGYNTYDDKNDYSPIDPKDALKSLYEEGTSAYMCPYIRKASNGFTFSVEIHRPDFNIFSVPTKPMMEEAVGYCFKNEITVKTYKDEDQFILACLHYIRHVFREYGHPGKEAKLSYLLDVCILAKDIVTKVGWENILERTFELRATEKVYHTIIRAKYLCDALFQEWIIKKLESRIEEVLLPRNKIYHQFANYKSHFLECILRYDSELDRLEDTIQELKKEGLVGGKVNCHWEKNTLTIYNSCNDDFGVINIDHNKVPSWNFYNYICIKDNHLSDPSVNFYLDEIGSTP